MKTVEKNIKRQSRCRFNVRKLTKKDYMVSLRKTNQYMYLQIVNIREGKTVLTISSKAVSDKRPNKEIAKKFGAYFAEKTKDLFKGEVPGFAFDRSGYKFHGRIREVVEVARESGIQF